MSNDQDRRKDAGSRRKFINYSMLSAAALGAAQKASGETGAPIRIPDVIPTAISTPGKPAAFPMRGAQVFAKVCKEEGLAALFCRACVRRNQAVSCGGHAGRSAPISLRRRLDDQNAAGCQ